MLLTAWHWHNCDSCSRSLLSGPQTQPLGWPFSLDSLGCMVPQLSHGMEPPSVAAVVGLFAGAPVPLCACCVSCDQHIPAGTIGEKLPLRSLFSA